MHFPYAYGTPPESWPGWDTLKSLDRDDLTPQEQEEKHALYYDQMMEFQETYPQKAIVEYACSSPDIAAVCVIIFGSLAQTEFTQFQDGTFLLAGWDCYRDKVIEMRSAIPDFDLRRELESLRKEGFNLRSDDNRNPDLDSGTEMRYRSVYLAVGSDIEWMTCPVIGAGRYKNNAINRIFLVDLAWFEIQTWLEGAKEINDRIADHPGINMLVTGHTAEFFARRSEFCGVELV